jgi:hypothetical protein
VNSDLGNTLVLNWLNMTKPDGTEIVKLAHGEATKV